MEKNKVASAVLVVENGKILAVSRKEDPDSWGFPGGKSEDNESPISTAAREFLEEVGVPVFNLRKIHEGNHFDFYVTLYSGEIGSYIKTHINADGCTVDWVDPSALKKGAFAKYNSDILDLLELK